MECIVCISVNISAKCETDLIILQFLYKWKGAGVERMWRAVTGTCIGVWTKVPLHQV